MQFLDGGTKMKTRFQCSATVRTRRRANQRGNALIEFALCAVFLVMITVAVTDFSRLFQVADTAASAAAAGAQYGALSPAHWSDFTGQQTASLNDAGNTPGVTATGSNTCYCSVGGASTTCPATCGVGSPMTYVTVTVTVPFTSYFSYPWMPSVPSVTTTNSVRVQ
jgi:Flp pilus assembly protein TadG